MLNISLSGGKLCSRTSLRQLPAARTKKLSKSCASNSMSMESQFKVPGKQNVLTCYCAYLHIASHMTTHAFGM